jgi:hypothetical protein
VQHTATMATSTFDRILFSILSLDNSLKLRLYERHERTTQKQKKLEFPAFWGFLVTLRSYQGALGFKKHQLYLILRNLTDFRNLRLSLKILKIYNPKRPTSPPQTKRPRTDQLI